MISLHGPVAEVGRLGEDVFLIAEERIQRVNQAPVASMVDIEGRLAAFRNGKFPGLEIDVYVGTAKRIDRLLRIADQVEQVRIDRFRLLQMKPPPRAEADRARRSLDSRDGARE